MPKLQCKERQGQMCSAGGIQRYMEQFPDGGLFHGKNFVFDERVAVAPEKASLSAKALSSCLICQTSCDDYSCRRRCSSAACLSLSALTAAQG